MSVEIPKVTVAFGSVAPPQGDVIDLHVHLGCTNEVSSFGCLLQNWDKKYSPNGSYPISVGVDGHVDVGRGLLFWLSRRCIFFGDVRAKVDRTGKMV